MPLSKQSLSTMKGGIKVTLDQERQLAKKDLNKNKFPILVELNDLINQLLIRMKATGTKEEIYPDGRFSWTVVDLQLHTQQESCKARLVVDDHNYINYGIYRSADLSIFRDTPGKDQESLSLSWNLMHDITPTVLSVDVMMIRAWHQGKSIFPSSQILKNEIHNSQYFDDFEVFVKHMKWLIKYLSAPEKLSIYVKGQT